jgi:transmembrane sensor
MSDGGLETESVGKDARAGEQATQWFALMHSDACTEQDAVDHAAWIASNDTHKVEYGALEQMWELLGSYADRPEIVKERQHIKPPIHQQARQGNVRLQQEITQLQQKSNRLQQLSARLQREAQKELTGSETTGHPPRFSPTRYALVASLLVVVLSSGLVFQGTWFKNTWNQLFNESVYQTGIGEQKTFYLADGSSVVLDTQTTVMANFSDDLRHIVLESGQARFDVARDEQRPFVVHAANGITTALGTAFIVRKSEDGIVVTLIHGKVAVAQKRAVTDESLAPLQSEAAISQGGSPVYREILLEAGQQVEYSEQGLSMAKEVDIKRATAWQQGRLIFEDYSLRKVLDELNRYSEKKIVLGDNSLASIRVTGVFKSGDNRKAIQALKTYFSMRVTTDLQGNLVLLQKQADSITD